MCARVVSTESPEQIHGPRILVGICSGREHRSLRDAARETWLGDRREGIKTAFFIGSGDEPLADGPDVVEVDAADGPDHLAAKTRAFFKHALETSDFEWLFKCDDESYVALERLPDLIDGRHDFVGAGAPSRQADAVDGCCLLSRRMVERFVADDGPGNAGAAPFATGRLLREPSSFPRQDNDIVGAGGCSPERMRAIHALFRDELELIRVIHPGWQDHIHFHADGYFMRHSTSCSGRWEAGDTGEIHLRWFDWPWERLSVAVGTGDGSADGEIVAYCHAAGPAVTVKTITVKLAHGLGNQMFQYAHGLALARRFNAAVKLNWEGGAREYALALFGLELDEETHGRNISYSGSYSEGEWPSLAQIIKSGAEHIALRGYFQNENFFGPVRDEVRRVFALEPALPVETGGRLPVCVHVRRGDYLHSSNHHLCDTAYYLNGIAVIRGLVENPLFVVVSDDPEWCAATFGDIPDLVVLPEQSTEDALRTLYACKAFVISNSTFGWWGAWMSGAKIVVAPRRFLAHKRWDICPERWVLLPCRHLLEP